MIGPVRTLAGQLRPGVGRGSIAPAACLVTIAAALDGGPKRAASGASPAGPVGTCVVKRMDREVVSASIGLAGNFESQGVAHDGKLTD